MTDALAEGQGDTGALVARGLGLLLGAFISSCLWVTCANPECSPLSQRKELFRRCPGLATVQHPTEPTGQEG